MSHIRMSHRQNWSFEIYRDEERDANWPDSRDQPYSHTGKTYRPQRVTLTFVQRDNDPVHLDAACIYGPRYTKAGQGAIASEHFYSPEAVDELWFTRLVAECRAKIAESLI